MAFVVRRHAELPGHLRAPTREALQTVGRLLCHAAVLLPQAEIVDADLTGAYFGGASLESVIA